MKAIWYSEFGSKPTLKEVSLPKLQSDAVLVKVHATGICGSDRYGWEGHDPDIVLPHIPGHEFSGEVFRVGSAVRKWNRGARVTAPFIQACGNCHYCLARQQQVCEHQHQAGFTGWGSFAEYVQIKYADENLVGIPTDMSYSEAAVLGCRFGTAYHALVHQASLIPGQWLAIFGCGGLGLAAAMIAEALGVRILAFDPNKAARRLAEDFGAHTFADLDAKAEAQIRDLTTYGVHVSVDAYGSGKVLTKASRVLRNRGKHIQVGLLKASDKIGFRMDRLVGRELEIIGSHGVQAHRYGEMFDFISRHGLKISHLIHKEVSLKSGIDHLVEPGKKPGITIIKP